MASVIRVNTINSRSGLSTVTFDNSGAGVEVAGIVTATSRVLAGTTTKGHADADELTIASSGRTGMTIRSGSSEYGNIFFSDATSGSGEHQGIFQYYHADDAFIWKSGSSATERLRIGAAGISTFTNDVRIVKTSGPLLELTTNTGSADATLRLSEGTPGSTTNGGGMFYSGADNKLHITCGTNSTTKRITVLRDDGKVGIGTESPSQVLTVRADSTPQILLKPTDATPALFVGDTIRTGEGQHLAEYRGNWDGTTVGRMVIVAGDDTGNKDNGEITFNTASAGSTIERLRIKSDGKVLVGSGCTDASLFNVKGSAGFADDGTNAGLIISTDDTNGAALSCLTAGGFVGGSYGVMRLNALQHKFTYGNTVRLNIKSDGNIETDGNLKTNNITGKNLVINGSFQVDQRNNGAELSISSNTKFSADRWTHNNDGHTYYKTQRKNDGPIQTIGTEYYMRATITTALSQGSGNNSQCIENNLEGNTVRWLNLGTSGAKQCTLSFWVRCSLTGTFGGALVNSGYNRCHPFSYTVSSANTWEYKTFTFATTGFTSGNFDTGTGVGLRLVFSYGNGTGRQASADQWHNGVKFGPTGETCLVATNGATLDLASVQLEEGTQATRFDHKSYAEELRLCQRYYYRTVADNNKFFPGMGMADIDGNTVILNTQFPVRMRSAPSALEQTGTASDYKIRRSTTATCTSAPSFGHATLDQVTTNFVKSSHGWGDGSAVRCMGGTSGAYLGWSAEL